MENLSYKSPENCKDCLKFIGVRNYDNIGLCSVDKKSGLIKESSTSPSLPECRNEVSRKDFIFKNYSKKII